MDLEDLIKKLEDLRDCKNYSKNNAMNTGYREGILDAIDLVKTLTIPVVIESCETCKFNSECRHKQHMPDDYTKCNYYIKHVL